MVPRLVAGARQTQVEEIAMQQTPIGPRGALRSPVGGLMLINEWAVEWSERIALVPFAFL